MYSIYKANFKTSEDRTNFCNLVKKILRNSSKFTVSTQKFDLGYADINLNCVTEKVFLVWKQVASKWESGEEQQKEEDEDNLEIEYEYGYDQHNQNNYGEVIFLEGEIEGMETYHRLTIEMIQLNKEDVDEDNEDGKDGEWQKRS